MKKLGLTGDKKKNITGKVYDEGDLITCGETGEGSGGGIYE